MQKPAEVQQVAAAEPPAPKPDPAPPKPAATPPPAPAEAPPASPKFEIARFDVAGNTLLPDETIAKVVAPYVGKQKDFADVQRALEALQLAYQDVGYGSVQVTLPEQELDKGVVVLKIIETRIGKVDVEGNQFFDEANIRRSLPALKEGTTPNSKELAANIRLANENPAKQVGVTLRQGTNENEIDSAVKVTDDREWRISATLDNTGTPETSMIRIGFGYQHANVLDRDQVLTVQYVTSPERLDDSLDKVKIFGVGYRIPLYGLGDSVDLLGAYSNVNSGVVQTITSAAFNTTGSGTVFGARYNHNLPRWGQLEHKLIYGFDWKSFTNNVTATGSTNNLVPDITVHPISLTYSGVWRAANSELSFYLSVLQNVFPHGNDAGQSDFSDVSNGGRAEAKASYRVYRYGATYIHAFANDIQVRLVAAGQDTRDALISPEQFGVGGFDSVRGLLEREIANDRGYRGQIEVYSPDLVPKLGWDSEKRMRLLWFFDSAAVSRNHLQPSEIPGQSVSSTGVGLRMSYSNTMAMRLDYAQIIDAGISGTRIGTRGDNRVHFGFSLLF